ncbi:cytochrome b5-like heme steroid binding domain containing protein [Stylonychia lemnae]|uniref:Cytochrome b5-like heme steroid binding domain containing protein n=1 Tax=Stylonychia lemnae TaxID=5949 RepID=A0A077ZUK0_STYLE|nr:cytochrome b5-like heme steroid binding domain containing protein [Stylonychia lemnae]|eukprot:CDW73578.1 cytochrome b5-like heme steroid binding domain containing protein [Stylonychia lemnae]
MSLTNYSRSEFRELSETNEGSELDVKNDSLYIVIHGWMMWISWGLMGFAMVWSNRYLKQYWRLNMIIHSVCGAGIFILNLLFGLGAIYYLNWKIKISIHGLVGSILAIILPFACIGGIIARIILRKLRWKTSIQLTVLRTHTKSNNTPIQYLSYITLFFSQLAIIGGTMNYTKNNVNGSVLAFVHTSFYFFILIVYESAYRYFSKKVVPIREHEITMDYEEFYNRILKGEKLVILNDKVLDVGNYMTAHPAGIFIMEKNIGRDISKFFDGGYALEQDISPWNHSFQARKIVNKLVIGQIINQAKKYRMIVHKKIDINQSTSIFKMKMINKEQILHWNIKKEDNMTFGRHFQVVSNELPKIKRYYTICNSLSPQIYDELLRLIYEAIKNNNICQPDYEVFNKDSNELSMVVKKYKGKMKMSNLIHEQENLEMEVTGLMGKGLQMQKNGLYIAFTAGTGILTFIDLIANILLQNLEYLRLPSQSKNIQNPIMAKKFILFASFPCEQEVIGLELCQGLDNLCKQFSLDNFEFKLRLSNEKGNTRWNYQFLKESLQNIQNKCQNQINQIWVSGPPRMNQQIDQDFEKLCHLFNISNHVVDIL